ncbi:MAG: CRISPR-associated endonuclease Cas3'', partial [Candidatus Competibacteraceae bacterium]|nr:CRISPR-associated endonuclease Cas3'' [Candidatus Competibacteraceae bacterium]
MIVRSQYFAHSANAAGHWHPLSVHLNGVGKLARDMLTGWAGADEALLAGLLHDLGKYGDPFQARLRGERSGLDHWSVGAWSALKDHGCIAAALAIQGHHVGLQRLDIDSLKDLNPEKLQIKHPLRLDLTSTNPVQLLERLKDDGLVPNRPAVSLLKNSTRAGIARMMMVRMLFSALVDADFLDTEAHFQGDDKGKLYRRAGHPLQPSSALEKLQDYLADLRQVNSATKAINTARETLLEDCLAAAAWPTGLFTLTAPTGCGKTLAMLAFAIAHAERHNLQRVVMVIPYLSIIEQTADIYRRIFEPYFGEHYVLEHHSLAGQGAEGSEDDAVNPSERRRRLLSENWDAPLVVTTSVQLLESL